MNHLEIAELFSLEYLSPVEGIGTNTACVAINNFGEKFVVKESYSKETGMSELLSLKSWIGIDGLVQLADWRETKENIYLSVHFIESTPLWPDAGPLDEISRLLKKIHKAKPSKDVVGFLEKFSSHKVLQESAFGDAGLMKQYIEEAAEHKEDSYLHFDFYPGNILISKKNTPFIIDPSGCLGPALWDIASYATFTNKPKETFLKMVDYYKPQMEALEPLWKAAVLRQNYIAEKSRTSAHLRSILNPLAKGIKSGQSAASQLGLS